MKPSPAACRTLSLVALLLVAGFRPALSAAPDLRATGLRCEYRTNPIGLDAPHPRLGWILESGSRAQKQSAYRILVASSRDRLDADAGDLWDTGKVASSESIQIAYSGKQLRSYQPCWWKVRVWDGAGRPCGWSAPASWSMGPLRPSDWHAKWIGAADMPDQVDDPVYRPAPLLRRTFPVRTRVKRALLTATAGGLFEALVNGARVGADYFTPGWTEYAKRVYYRTYDVTPLLRPGAPNVLGVMLGDGWYGLHHGGRGRLRLLAQLRIEYADGSVAEVVSDAGWKSTLAGPVRMSDIYNGETYDARREMAGWAAPGFDDRMWKPVVVDGPGSQAVGYKDVTDVVRRAVADGRLTIVASNETFGGDPAYGQVKSLRVRYRLNGRVRQRSAPENATLRLGPAATPDGLEILEAEYGAPAVDLLGAATLQAHPGPPVRKTGIVKPIAVTEPKPGVFVFDLGQNMVGWARLKVQGEAGTRVTLRFAEMLNPDGTIYTANLRGARCTDRYTLRGGGPETWEPRFTFHGFRYVEVTGYPGAPAPEAITGIVLHSDAPLTSSFACADARLNRLYQNIVWGQRGNYLEVPTDCPQRDERMGWSGDAQAFIPTGAYNMDVAAFFTAWLRTFDDAQDPDGGFPNVAPKGGGVSPGWGDAGVICPWTIFEQYLDRRILAEHYPAMVRWIRYLKQRSRGLLRPDEGFGDWLNVHEETPKDVIATAYFARAADLTSRIAAILGKRDDAGTYRKLFADIRAAFNTAYVAPDGRIKGDTQTAYVLALGFDLLPPTARDVAARRLVELIAGRDDHLSVGFLGVPLILPVLSDIGRSDLAWKLMMNDTYPSWLYEVKNGATTIWERWDGWTTERGFQTPSMNSFNHYAFGSCGRWLFETAAGIASDGPGFRQIVIRPTPGGGLGWLRAHYDSVRGRIATAWSIRPGWFELAVTLPANTTARVYVPTTDARAVTESGRPAASARGVRFLRTEGPCAVFEVGSGRYSFRAPAAR